MTALLPLIADTPLLPWRLRNGMLTFNSLLCGLLIGGMYAPGPPTLMLLATASVLALLLTVWVSALLARHNLPHLSAAFLTVDGQRSVALQLGDTVTISCDVDPLRLVPPEHNVFQVLATKLGWSGPR